MCQENCRSLYTLFSRYWQVTAAIPLNISAENTLPAFPSQVKQVDDAGQFIRITEMDLDPAAFHPDPAYGHP